MSRKWERNFWTSTKRHRDDFPARSQHDSRVKIDGKSNGGTVLKLIESKAKQRSTVSRKQDGVTGLLERL